MSEDSNSWFVQKLFAQLYQLLCCANIADGHDCTCAKQDLKHNNANAPPVKQCAVRWTLAMGRELHNRVWHRQNLAHLHTFPP